MGIKQKISYECDICGEISTKEDKHVIPNIGVLLCPVIPDEWRLVADLLVCPKHRVEIDGGLKNER